MIQLSSDSDFFVSSVQVWSVEQSTPSGCLRWRSTAQVRPLSGPQQRHLRVTWMVKTQKFSVFGFCSISLVSTGISYLSLLRITCTRSAQLSARPSPGQQYCGELDATREPGHCGAWLHHRVWHRQPSCSNHQSGLQAALLHHWEPW